MCDSLLLSGWGYNLKNLLASSHTNPHQAEVTMSDINFNNMPNLSEKAKTAITNINKAFNSLNEMLAKEVSCSGFQDVDSAGHNGVVHGSEYVIDRPHNQRQRAPRRECVISIPIKINK